MASVVGREGNHSKFEKNQTQPGDSLLVRVGVIADVQYCDRDDCYNFDQTMIRHYRESLSVLQKAVEFWNESNIEFVVQLGDLLDGHCSRLGQSAQSLQQIMDIFKRLTCQHVHHVIGNHELYNFSRSELSERLGSPSSYFSFEPCAHWRLIVLDSYSDSHLGHEEGSEKWHHAVSHLRKHNPNDILSDGVCWLEGLEGHAQRFVPYNGGLGDDQVSWLRGELKEATLKGQRAILFSHCILHPDACEGSTMVWDFEKALEVIAEFRAVAAVFCGHDHSGGYACDETGVHHITLKSPLNKGAAGNCFGCLTLHRDHIEICGPDLGDLLDGRLLAVESPQVTILALRGLRSKPPRDGKTESSEV